MGLLSVLIIFTLYFIVLNTSENNYGPYKVVWQKIDTCKGPKQGDCGEIILENTHNLSDVIFRLDFTKDCPVTAAKIMVSTKQKNNEMKKLWNHVLSKPCDHFVMGPVMKESFNVTSNQCKVNKGKYTIHVDYVDKFKTFLGPSFFYGSYSFKMISYNKVNNFICVISILDIVKIS